MLPLLLALVQAEPSPPAAAPPAFAAVAFRHEGHASLGDAGSYFPERAMRLHQGGAVALDCAPTDAGALDDCRVKAETPPDFGFSQAALLMAKRRFMTLAKPYAAQPRTAEGRVLVMVRFPRAP